MDATKKAATIGAPLFGLLCLLAVAARNASRGGINEPAKKERDGRAGSREETPGRRALRIREKLFGFGNRQISIEFAGDAGTIVGELPDDRGRLDLSTLTLDDVKVESITTRGATVDSVPAAYDPFLVALRDNVDVRVGVLEFEFDQSIHDLLATMYEPTDNSITGTFPQDHTTLQELDTPVLAYWDVGFNKFEGTIPNDIPEKMPDLQVMFGEDNKFSGTLPDNLGALDLKNVHLDDNDFTGAIPSTLGDPPNLESLLLHGNQFTGSIPDSLATPKKLIDATFHYNPLEGEVSNSICENMYQGVFESISVDCETITCECCICSE